MIGLSEKCVTERPGIECRQIFANDPAQLPNRIHLGVCAYFLIFSMGNFTKFFLEL